MSFVFFAWMASILYGLEVIISKLVSKYSVANAWLFNFVWSGVILLVTFPIAAYYHFGFPKTWENLLLASIFYTLTGIFYVLALYRLEVSVMSPLFSVRPVVAAILAFFMLGESLNSIQVLLVCLVFFSSIAVTYDEHWSFKSFTNLGVIFLLIEVVCVSLYGVYLNKSLKENNFWTVTVFVPLISQFMLLLTYPLFRRNVSSLRPKNMMAIFLMSLFGTFATLVSNKAFAQNVSISTIVISLPISMILAFVLSILVPKLLEKHGLKVYLVRFVAAAIMISAAVKLSLM